MNWKKKKLDLETEHDQKLKNYVYETYYYLFTIQLKGFKKND